MAKKVLLKTSGLFYRNLLMILGLLGFSFMSASCGGNAEEKMKAREDSLARAKAVQDSLAREKQKSDSAEAARIELFRQDSVRKADSIAKIKKPNPYKPPIHPQTKYGLPVKMD
jgi:hypothetical protein